MSTDSQVEAVAEAICAADPNRWSGKDEQIKDWYRNLARAAIDALQLTPEWRGAYDTWRRTSGGKKVDCVEYCAAVDEEQALRFAESTNWHAESRLVSPWVAVEGTKKGAKKPPGLMQGDAGPEYDKHRRAVEGGTQ